MFYIFGRFFVFSFLYFWKVQCKRNLSISRHSIRWCV